MGKTECVKKCYDSIIHERYVKRLETYR